MRMDVKPLETRSPPAEKPRVPAGWQIVRLAAAAAVVVDLVGIPLYVTGTSPELRLPYALAALGLLVVRGLALYGAWYRTRWSAWLGAVLAVGNLLGPFVGSTAITETAVTRLLGILGATAGAAFLAGLIVIRRARRG
jgi:hypothetical protein